MPNWKYAPKISELGDPGDHRVLSAHVHRWKHDTICILGISIVQSLFFQIYYLFPPKMSCHRAELTLIYLFIYLFIINFVWSRSKQIIPRIKDPQIFKPPGSRLSTKWKGQAETMVQGHKFIYLKYTIKTVSSTFIRKDTSHHLA